MPDLKTELGKLVIPQERVVSVSEHPQPYNKRRENKRAVASPVFVRKLAEKYGNTETGRLIGYSPSGVSTAINDRDEIAATAEFLAERIWREIQQEEPKTRDRTFIVKVQADKADGFRAMCNAMDLSTIDVDGL